eukprot:Nitzschia sp. Nitz4//scaffold110_size71422//39697//40758//NITZ4_005874-RA/size71422-processed-gene-0.71-mRNA-1//-1//CDS//3329533089//1400//frame0
MLKLARIIDVMTSNDHHLGAAGVETATVHHQHHNDPRATIHKQNMELLKARVLPKKGMKYKVPPKKAWCHRWKVEKKVRFSPTISTEPCAVSSVASIAGTTKCTRSCLRRSRAPERDGQGEDLAIQTLVETLQKLPILKWAAILSTGRLRICRRVNPRKIDASTTTGTSPSLPLHFTIQDNNRQSPAENDHQEHVVSMLDPANNVWFDMFYIKPSNIPGAGMGLFAAKAYPKDTCLGVYFGALTSVNKQEYSCYAMGVNRRFGGTIENFVVEQTGHTERTTGSGGPPPYFGFQFCNDPNYPGSLHDDDDDDNVSSSSTRYQHNVAVRDDLSVFALKPIAQGEELFLNYNMGDV